MGDGDVVVGVGEAVLILGVALGVVLELLDVLWLAVGEAVGVADELLLVGVALALVLADALLDGVALAEAEALPEGRALTEADALLDAEELAEAEELPEGGDALADAVGDVDVAACLAALLLTGFLLADFGAAEECAAVAERAAAGDMADWAAESRRMAALGRLEQAPFTICGPPPPRSKVTELKPAGLVVMISAPATPPIATDLSATALTT